jgi:predicted dehydrogenase
VEKPLCLTRGELAQLRDGYTRAQQTPRPPILMVGFNRRFAPQVVRMKTLLDGVPGPKSLVMTVNAGRIPAAHWIHDVKVGGGRLIGEACHFIDLLRHLVGAPIISCDVASVTESGSKLSSDSFAVTLRFADGSIGALQYISSGHKGLPKERLEVFGGGRVLQLENFRRLSGFGWPEFSSMRLWRQDKGQFACVAAFLEAIRSGATAPIAPDDIFEVAEICIALAERM